MLGTRKSHNTCVRGQVTESYTPKIRDNVEVTEKAGTAQMRTFCLNHTPNQ